MLVPFSTSYKANVVCSLLSRVTSNFKRERAVFSRPEVAEYPTLPCRVPAPRLELAGVWLIRNPLRTIVNPSGLTYYPQLKLELL